ncbi:DUF1924 domain-containing protein [Crenobacter sp. SG2303]|uniref:DUF1924 domain-containing protein n=1 Tax=Crenobacter oryzisoli TaxID=3056844 RepID=A0ABT7XLE3_9NEIS|nr:DUF1924 domain-containing protein [Crenobacter sp. SG2303]MDN0074570.1 DUF1924 domain-containing protein [Crenobacter sp. SG2303]
MLLLLATAAQAGPAEQIAGYRSAAQAADPSFKDFSAERGRELYYRKVMKNGKMVSCASCHSQDPRQPGQTPAFRPIGPMATAVNPKRFTDPQKTEKWFRRNCDDVLSRQCTPQEKGDYLTFLSSIR